MIISHDYTSHDAITDIVIIIVDHQNGKAAKRQNAKRKTVKTDSNLYHMYHCNEAKLSCPESASVERRVCSSSSQTKACPALHDAAILLLLLLIMIMIMIIIMLILLLIIIMIIILIMIIIQVLMLIIIIQILIMIIIVVMIIMMIILVVLIMIIII